MKRKYRRGNKATASKSQRKKKARTSSRKSPEPKMELPLSRDELVQMAQDSLHTFAVEMGLLIAGRLLEEEVDRLCGPRYTRDKVRRNSRHGSQGGTVDRAWCRIASRSRSSQSSSAVST